MDGIFGSPFAPQQRVFRSSGRALAADAASCPSSCGDGNLRRDRCMRRSTWFTLFALFAALCAAETAHAQTLQYFPQLADGGGYVTTWYFTGLGSGPSVVTLELFQSNGSPLMLSTNKGNARMFTFNLGSSGELSIRTLGAPLAVQVGWARVTSSQPI